MASGIGSSHQNHGNRLEAGCNGVLYLFGSVLQLTKLTVKTPLTIISCGNLPYCDKKSLQLDVALAQQLLLKSGRSVKQVILGPDATTRKTATCLTAMLSHILKGDYHHYSSSDQMVKAIQEADALLLQYATKANLPPLSQAASDETENPQGQEESTSCES